MLPLQYSFPCSEAYLKFVVHFHQATHLHYDLRLELGKMLFNLVLPKGPSLNPDVHRLAIRTHDHAKSCLTFEGRVRTGQYGAGPLLIWDRGLYAPYCTPGVSHEEAMLFGIAKGSLRLNLEGEKLKGGWLLERRKENWRFVKLSDRFASQQDVRLLDRSVVSGRRLEEL